MASVVNICNMALSHIGASAQVTSISPPDGSVEAGYCATFYPQARAEMLEPGNWRFSLKRASLAQVTNASTVWAYAYAMPSDCLNPLRILSAGNGVTVFTEEDAIANTNDRGSSEYDIEGDVLFSNEAAAVLIYVRDITDTSRFTPSFTTALSYLLAGYLSGPILKGSEGARVAQSMRQLAQSMAAGSAATSANASKSVNSRTPDILSARR